VRALLVPAITHLLGDRAWWPSTLSVADRTQERLHGEGVH
jgi:uncharacterized membrane protein YdfJ with MMPL/SSD domain